MRGLVLLSLLALPLSGCLEGGGPTSADCPEPDVPCDDVRVDGGNPPGADMPTTPPSPTPPAADDDTASSASSFRTLAQGDQSGHHGEVRAVLETEAEWRAFWRTHSAIQTPEPEAPAVDWARERVIAIVLADKPSGGYGVRIEDVRVEGETTVVEAVTYTPPPDAATASVISQPFHFVAAAKGPAHVRWDERTAQSPPPASAS